MLNTLFSQGEQLLVREGIVVDMADLLKQECGPLLKLSKE